MSFVGKRSLVSMKHVGLNVAADPLMNSAITGAHGALELAVADDHGRPVLSYRKARVAGHRWVVLTRLFPGKGLWRTRFSTSRLYTPIIWMIGSRAGTGRAAPAAASRHWHTVCRLVWW